MARCMMTGEFVRKKKEVEAERGGQVAAAAVEKGRCGSRGMSRDTKSKRRVALRCQRIDCSRLDSLVRALAHWTSHLAYRRKRTRTHDVE